MKKMLVAGIGIAIALTGTAGATVATVNAARTTPAPTLKCTAVLRKHPDGGAQNWANDTFWRTTVFTKHTSTTWNVTVTDKGFFWTQPGKTSIGDKKAPITNLTYGTFSGGASYSVTSTRTPACLGLANYPEGYVYRDGPSTSEWPNHYFDGATKKDAVSAYTKWGWTYTTTYKVGSTTKTCETMTDRSGATPGDEVITGDVTGKICH